MEKENIMRKKISISQFDVKLSEKESQWNGTD